MPGPVSLDTNGSYPYKRSAPEKRYLEKEVLDVACKKAAFAAGLSALNRDERLVEVQNVYDTKRACDRIFSGEGVKAEWQSRNAGRSASGLGRHLEDAHSLRRRGIAGLPRSTHRGERSRQSSWPSTRHGRTARSRIETGPPCDDHDRGPESWCHRALKNPRHFRPSVYPRQ